MNGVGVKQGRKWNAREKKRAFGKCFPCFTHFRFLKGMKGWLSACEHVSIQLCASILVFLWSTSRYASRHSGVWTAEPHLLLWNPSASLSLKKQCVRMSFVLRKYRSTWQIHWSMSTFWGCQMFSSVVSFAALGKLSDWQHHYKSATRSYAQPRDRSSGSMKPEMK